MTEFRKHIMITTKALLTPTDDRFLMMTIMQYLQQNCLEGSVEIEEDVSIE